MKFEKIESIESIFTKGAAHVESEGIGLFKKFVALEVRRDELEEELKEVKLQIDGLQDALRDEMCRQGIQTMRVDGRTVFMSTQIWASPAADKKQECIAALKKAGLAGAIEEKISTQTLSAWVREQGGSLEEVRENLGEMVDLLSIREDVKVKSRR